MVWFLVVPGTRQSINASANKQVTDANSKMASEASKVQGLEDEISDYQAKVDAANQTMEEANAKAESYEELLAAADLYISNPNNQAQAAEALGEIKAESLSGAAQDLYDHMMEAISDYVYNDAINAANTAYTNKNYQEAIEQYEKALEAKPGDEWALLYLGHAYYAVQDTANADDVFNELIQKYPAREAEVRPYISGTSSGGTRRSGDDSQDTVGGDNAGDEDSREPGSGNGAGDEDDQGTGSGNGAGDEGGQGTGSGDNAGDEDSREPGSSGDIDRTGGGRLGFVE